MIVKFRCLLNNICLRFILFSLLKHVPQPFKGLSMMLAVIFRVNHSMLQALVFSISILKYASASINTGKALL